MLQSRKRRFQNLKFHVKLSTIIRYYVINLRLLTFYLSFNLSVFQVWLFILGSHPASMYIIHPSLGRFKLFVLYFADPIFCWPDNLLILLFSLWTLSEIIMSDKEGAVWWQLILHILSCSASLVVSEVYFLLLRQEIAPLSYSEVYGFHLYIHLFGQSSFI